MVEGRGVEVSRGPLGGLLQVEVAAEAVAAPPICVFGKIVHLLKNSTLPSIALVQNAEFPWQQAIAQHGRRVVVALLARGAPLHQAEELAQEAWTRLISQRAKGELAQIELPGLAVRQALFLLSDSRRRVVHEPIDSALSQPGPDLERSVASKAALARALGALEASSPRAREIFDFVYSHPELKHEQAALQLGISTQRLRQTLCEVRQRMRAALEEKS